MKVDKSLGPISALILINCTLAVIVNVTSTWCAASCSSLLYGLLGQAKTLCTVFLGAWIFHVSLSFRSAVCLGISLLGVCIFMYLEDQFNKSKVVGSQDGVLKQQTPPFAKLGLFALSMMLLSVHVTTAWSRASSPMAREHVFWDKNGTYSILLGNYSVTDTLQRSLGR